MKKYKVGQIEEILEGVYNDKELRRTVVPLFMSEPGLGKTQVIEKFMRDKGVYKPPFVLSQRMPFEVSGMAMVDKEKDVMKYYNFDFFLELKDGDILFIDETYSANPNTLNAFLTFLESRIMISGKKLPDIMIVAAANPKGLPPLTPQIRRRFLEYSIEFDRESFSAFMLNKYGMPTIVSRKFYTLIESEMYTGWNYNSSADIDKAVDMIIKGVMTPYEDEIKPILETFIGNKLEEAIELADGSKFEPGETKSWLELIKIDRGFVLPESKKQIKNGYHDVKLTNPGKNKLLIIKTIKELTGLGLKEAKELADNVPSIIKSGIDILEATKITAALSDIGATVYLIENFTEEPDETNSGRISIMKGGEHVAFAEDMDGLKALFSISSNEEDEINSLNLVQRNPGSLGAGWSFKKQ